MTDKRNRLLTRRQLLHYASVLAAQSFFNVPQAIAKSAKGMTDYPFKLGIASGDPSSEGFVLWTRLVADIYDAESLPASNIPVVWQVSDSENMKTVIQSGTVHAKPDNAHSVHVEVYGLKPDREYFYRFICGGEDSPIGRTRTLPLLGANITQFKFAFASCQDISNGYFAAYRDMLKQDPKLIIHTGDYIYESIYKDGVRRIPVANALTLSDYRNLYSRYRLDSHLQAAHAACPWLSIWDDHEVENDWGGHYSESIRDQELFLQWKIAAFKAYYEHMPLRLYSRYTRGSARIYQRTQVGNLLEFNLLDCRQFRDPPPCRDDKGQVINYTPLCDEAKSTSRSMLGEEQEAWLLRGYGTSGASWNTLVQTAPIGPFDFKKGEGTIYKMDGWDGYVSTRQRIIDHIDKNKVRNPVAIGGEIHAFYAGVINKDPFDGDSPAVLSELISTSISSGGGDQRYQQTNEQFSENTFARFFENRFRGYMLCEVNHKEWNSTMRVVDNVNDPASSVNTLNTLTIKDGIVDVNVS